MQSTRNWRPWLAINACFAAVAAVALLLPAPAQGWRVLAPVVAYRAATVVASRRDPTLRRAWHFLAPFSVLMVLTDWFHSDVLGSLTFPTMAGRSSAPCPWRWRACGRSR